MTRRSKGLNHVCPKPYMEINVEDAKTLSLKNGDHAKVTSRRGTVELEARVTEKISRAFR